MQAELRWARSEDEQELYAMFTDPHLGAENWSSSVRMICAQCSVSNAHVHGEHERPDEIRLIGTWGFGGDESALRDILAKWSANGEGRTASDLELAEPA